MALSLAYDAHSEVGLVRANNQDSAYVSPRMLMVADGMGGAAAGDLASAVATWELEKTDAEFEARLDAARADRQDTPEEHDEDAGSLTDVLTVLASTLASANEKLIQLVEDDPTLAGMGTTVCGFVLHDDRLAILNIGDSRAYLIRDGRLHRVTRDHSWVQTLVDDGRISESEALDHPHRSLVLRVLNGSAQHEPDLGWLDVAPGDRLLVCTDGLCGLATDAEIAAIATTGEPRTTVIEGLVRLAHEAGGHDNITLVLADVVADGPAGITQALGAAAVVTLPTATERTASLPPLTEPTGEEAAERAITEEERYALLGRRKLSTRVRFALAFLLPLLALAGGGGLWYSYAQTQFYVGPHEAHVALYRGVPDRVLGLPLSTLLETDATALTDLPSYYADKVRAHIRVGSLQAARSTLVELRQQAAQCVEQRAARASVTTSPTPDAGAPPGTPAPSATPAPGAPPTPNATPTLVPPAPTAVDPTPTAEVTPAVAGEDC